MENIYEKALQASEFILSRISEKPDIAIILGTGLGFLVNEIQNQIEVDYKDIPNFPVPTVKGHDGKLVYGDMEGHKVLVMKGRVHYYEGEEISVVTFPIRVFTCMGIKTLIVTNAAGAINKTFKPGDLMLINDHIGLFSPSPLRGENIEQFGPRFNDMSEAYNKELRDKAMKAAKAVGVELKEGVYAFAKGPMYETPAEIRALEKLGADAVGMSTVPEVITAKHSGMDVISISCITNMAAGILEQPMNHSEVMEIAAKVEKKFVLLVKEIVRRL